jgi:hypothetical protein
MPRKKDDSILTVLSEIFAIAPWWVGPIVAILVFILVSVLIPTLMQSGLSSDDGNPGIRTMNNMFT